MAETTIIRNDLHRSELAVANGVASLDGSGKIPGSQISISSIINDSGTTSSDIWSANKTQTQINSAVVGLLDDRGNYTPAGSYPTTGGSGTAGAILKGDIWQISGLGSGVSALMNTRVVFDGDWVRALIDDPGQTDANWSESVTSSSNLGNANLVSADNARTFTLKSGGTATQNLQFLNSAGKKGFYFDGRGKVGLLTSAFDGTYGGETSNLNFGDSTNKVAVGIHLDNVSGSQYYAFRMFSGANVLQNVDARGFIQWHNQANNANTDIQFTLSGNGPRIYTNSPSTSLWTVGYGHYYNGTPQVQIATDNNTNGYITVHKFDGTINNIISGRRAYEATWFAEGIVLGGARYRAATPFFDVMGSGSTSATTTALFQNSSSAKLLEIKDDGQTNFGSTTSFVQPNIYLNSTLNDQFTIFRGSSYFVNINPLAWQLEVRGSAGKYVYLNGDSGMITTRGDNSGITLNNAAGNPRGYFYQQSLGGFFALVDSAGTRQVNLECGATAVIGLNTQIGGAYTDSLTAKFTVKGTGTTSSTTTALFQNSSSVACLTIKDDLTSTFGGIITVPQVITTPATITVTANAGTVTRANRINKFTNSSAATMTITMSTTAALDGDLVQVRIYDFSAVTQTITWVNTENSSVAVPATSNGSTTLPLTVGLQYNSATSKWRCIGSV